MPTYEYACDACGHHFEEFQSIKAKPTTVCPKCKKKKVSASSPAAGFLFKGSGFYITDYRSDSYKAAAKSDAAPAATPAKTDASPSAAPAPATPAAPAKSESKPSKKK